jgi:SHOCT-like domain
MPDPIEHLLQLVAEGKLSAEEAAPLLEALRRTSAPETRSRPSRSADDPSIAGRNLRVEVRERGRVVVDLTIPGSLAGLAAALPGMPPEWSDRIGEALAAGATGRIVDVAGNEGDGVSIRIE